MPQHIFQEEVSDEANRTEHTIKKQAWDKQQLGEVYRVSIMCYPPVKIKIIYSMIEVRKVAQLNGTSISRRQWMINMWLLHSCPQVESNVVHPAQ